METTLKGRIKQGELIFPKQHFDCADCFVDLKISDTDQIITLDMIMEAVCQASTKSPDELLAKVHKGKKAIPTLVTVYLATKYTKQSLKSIGRFLNMRHHTTIISDRDKVFDMLAKEKYARNTPYTDLVKKSEKIIKKKIEGMFN